MPPRAARVLEPPALPGGIPAPRSHLRQCDVLLPLVLPAAILVRSLADFVGLEEDHLRHTLVGVDLGRQRRSVRELECDVALPLGLERRHVDDDSAAGVRAFPEANTEHVAGYPEVFDG